MHLEGTLLVVKDVKRSREFYQAVLSSEVALDLDEYIVFRGGFCIMSESHWTTFNPGLTYQYGGNVCELSFEDEDIDVFMARLQQFPHLVIVSPLQEYAWGQRALRFYDPDEHIIEVGESMKTVAKRFLCSGMSVEETTQKMLFPREFVEMCQREMVSGHPDGNER